MNTNCLDFGGRQVKAIHKIQRRFNISNRLKVNSKSYLTQMFYNKWSFVIFCCYTETMFMFILIKLTQPTARTLSDLLFLFHWTTPSLLFFFFVVKGTLRLDNIINESSLTTQHEKCFAYELTCEVSGPITKKLHTFSIQIFSFLYALEILLINAGKY